MKKAYFLFCGLLFLNLHPIYAKIIATTTPAPIKVIAAENFYGELAHEIGGDNVEVQSIISSPTADPHLFATSSKISKLLENAQIIIYNGANYDPWMQQILNSLTKSLNDKSVIIINVADLMNVKNGDNPHIWYKPDTFSVLAQTLAKQIIKLNPHIRKKVDDNLANFLQQNQLVLNAIQGIKLKYKNLPVTATEPVYGYAAAAMGLDMQGIDFQWKIMNGTEPSPQILANFEQLITQHKIKLIFYNNQVKSPVTQNILDLAAKNNIPIVGITEIMPPHMNINQWQLDQINTTGKTLKLVN